MALAEAAETILVHRDISVQSECRLRPIPSLPSTVPCYHPPRRLEGKGRSREILGGQDMLKEVITQHRYICEKETEEK